MVITRDKLKLFSFYVNRFLSQSLFKRGTITIESEKPMYSSNNISSSTPVTTPVLTRNNFIRPDTINTQAGEQLIKAIKMERESRFKKINVLSLGFLTPISAFILYKRYNIINYTLFSTNAEEDIMLRDFIIKGVKGIVDFNKKA